MTAIQSAAGSGRAALDAFARTATEAATNVASTARSYHTMADGVRMLDKPNKLYVASTDAVSFGDAALAGVDNLRDSLPTAAPAAVSDVLESVSRLLGDNADTADELFVRAVMHDRVFPQTESKIAISAAIDEHARTLDTARGQLALVAAWARAAGTDTP